MKILSSLLGFVDGGPNLRTNNQQPTTNNNQPTITNQQQPTNNKLSRCLFGSNHHSDYILHLIFRLPTEHFSGFGRVSPTDGNVRGTI